MNQKLYTYKNISNISIDNELASLDGRYREYETKGEISILDQENITHMYEEYKNLGGNGTVKKIYGELLELHTKILK